MHSSPGSFRPRRWLRVMSSICIPARCASRATPPSCGAQPSRSSSSRRGCACCRRRSSRISCSTPCPTCDVCARAMRAQLTRYLRAALPRMRDHDACLADEIELVAAFLGVQKIRMGARLGSSIDVPAALLEAQVPSMMLATLVENAIKHGIGPLAEGGAIHVVAAREGETLVLSVADTGQGFATASGSGVGLANIRARLGALYGERAMLRLEANSPRGVLATIRLPWIRGEQRP